MKKYKVVIVGGGPVGISAGLELKKHYGKNEISLIRDNDHSLIPCAIPYLFDRIKKPQNNLISDEKIKGEKLDLIIDRVEKIEKDNQQLVLGGGDRISYQKLIIATGSQANKPPIEGSDLEGVYFIKKDHKYLKKLKEEIKKAQYIVIVGGGFIGVELADELSNLKNKNISIIEMLDDCLAANFDKEFCLKAKDILENKGVNLYLKSKVKKIEGENKVKSVLVGDKKIKADLVVIAVGNHPNVLLAENSGIKFDKKSGVEVNQQMETSIEGIYAVGDCAQKTNYLTKKKSPILLASTGCQEARIAVNNLVSGNKITNRGTIGAFSTCIGDTVFAMAGINEKQAKENNIEYVKTESEVNSRHPQTLPGNKKIFTKLLFRKKEKEIIGGQILGPKTIAQIPYLLSLAIENNLQAADLKYSQLATHPLLTSPPTAHCIVKAAEKIV